MSVFKPIYSEYISLAIPNIIRNRVFFWGDKILVQKHWHNLMETLDCAPMDYGYLHYAFYDYIQLICIICISFRNWPSIAC